VPDYGRYCPVALGSEVLADRWTPLIVRELVLGSTRFNEIARCLPGISRTLLAQRLKHLERKGVLVRTDGEYRLTPAGQDLEDVIVALGRWTVQWLFDDLDNDDVDAVTLLWWMHRRVDTARLPDERVVVQFDHTAPERVTIWMVLDRGEASVCLQHPGFDPDVVVRCTTPALAAVFSGVDSWNRAVDDGDIEVRGTPRLRRALHRWFLWSPFAPDARARSAMAAGPRRGGS
jgi:DNA-binding HxlR family transcriptional regulator